MRNRVIGVMSLIFALYVLAELAVNRFILMPSFYSLEEAEAQKDIERVKATLQREIDAIIPQATDWASWDDTYLFMGGVNPEYAASNLVPSSIENAHVDLLALYDAEGNKTWLGRSQAVGDSADLGPMQLDRLPADAELRATLLPSSPRSAILRTPYGPFIVASSPILMADGSGSQRGNVIFARHFGVSELAALAEQAQVDVRFAPLSAVTNESLKRRETSTFGPSEFIEHDGHRQVRIGVFGSDGGIAFALELKLPRLISAQGKRSVAFASVSVALAGVVVVVAMLMLLSRLVFRPLEILTAHAVQVGESDRVNAKLNLQGFYEFDVLAREFDGMLERLAEARARLLDQSFKSGVAEMASGVLHNIGNSMVPLSTKLVQAADELAQAPHDDIRMAIAELEDSNTDSDRRRDLEMFLCMAAREFQQMVERAHEMVEAARDHTNLVQHILNDQNRLSRAERVSEVLDLEAIAHEGLRLLPESLSSKLQVRVVAAKGVGPAWSARVAVQQVVNNLLLNAAEAVAECGLPEKSGRIVVEVAPEEHSDGAAVVLRVTDNGVGIARDNLEHLFERGFSTKNRGSGLGLHWSFNTASALGGRIRAHSMGSGQGATFELVLPSAATAAAYAEGASA